VLRQFSPARFILQAADALGQVRWEVRRDQDEAVWFDAPAQHFCRLDARLALRTPQWVASISISDIAGLLTGDWPPQGGPAEPPVSPSSQSPQPVPATRTRITGERAARNWASWTLWEGSEPAAWFKRLGTDALLSVRKPSVQVRWRVTARSDLSDSAFVLLPGELTASSREIACPDNAIP